MPDRGKPTHPGNKNSGQGNSTGSTESRPTRVMLTRPNRVTDDSVHQGGADPAQPGGADLAQPGHCRFGPVGERLTRPKNIWVRVDFPAFSFILYLFNPVFISFIYTTTAQLWGTGVTSPTLVPEDAGDSQSRAQSYKNPIVILTSDLPAQASAFFILPHEHTDI